MNLMSVDIPSKRGKSKTKGPWGQVVLIQKASEVRGDRYLRVLVYLDLDAFGLMRVFTRRNELCLLRSGLEDLSWLICGSIAHGTANTVQDITNVRPALASLARKLGELFDENMDS